MSEPATIRLTMAQALIRFLKNQYVERDGVETQFFAGCLGIFGHGCVAGVGEALVQNPDFRYYQVRNEQGAVHAATAYTKVKNRLQTFACISSIGPGATNMITGAATATINRLPVLLLPGDIFARRNVAPVLQQLEWTQSQDVSVNDCFKPVSKYWDRINRPDQLLTALPEAMRVLTSPAEAGAVTLALPQDVQTEAYDYPVEFFRKRVWHIMRNRADRATLAACRRNDPSQQKADDRGRRRCDLCRRHRDAAAVRGRHRHPGRRDDGRQGQPALGPSAEPGRDRRHRHVGGQPHRQGRRPGDRHRHPLQRLHDGLQDRLAEPRRALRQHQRHRVRRRQAPWPAGGRRRPGHAGGAGRTAGWLRRGPGLSQPKRSGCTTNGTPRCSASTTSAWSLCPARAS